MKELSALRIHVAPVGFEEDRVVVPAKSEKADRMWLLVHAGDAKGRVFRDAIRNKMNEAGVEVREKSHDRGDLFDIIRSTREIIHEEAGNHVYVNLSSGSKIQAVGCMMACMMFNDSDNVSPYYAEPEKYERQEENKPLSTGIKKIIVMPQYKIRIPPDRFVKTLHVVSQAGGPITKKKLLERLKAEGILEENADLSAMDRTIFRPFEDWRFLRVKKIGRNRWVSLTDEGKNAARFLPGELPP